MEGEGRVVRIRDERDPLAHATLELIHTAIGDVQPTADLLSELEEDRRGMPSGGRYHLLALVDGNEEPQAAAAGVYLDELNVGFITYLAVRPELRGKELGSGLRETLIEGFREDARAQRGQEPAWVVGEVRATSPWLRSLVARGRVIPFGFSYFHPWLPRRAEGRYVLYREPLGDDRTEIPAREVVRLVYAIWRRAYRIRYPLQHETFCYMLDCLEERGAVGPDLPGDDS